jgi:hypothetical protein
MSLPLLIVDHHPRLRGWAHQLFGALGHRDRGSMVHNAQNQPSSC